MRRFLLLLSLAGAGAFGAALVLSFLNPLLIENLARGVVRIEVERRTGERIDALSDSRVAGLAQRALQQTERDIDETRRAIREELPRRVANVMADMLKADCECRRRLVAHQQAAAQARLASLADVKAHLATLIESTYAEVSSHLLREFRIFTASNALAFAVLALATGLRRQSTIQLLLPAVALVGAVAITGSLYLLQQNWLHTIVFGQYVGWAYAAYLASVGLLLLDVLLNRARVTTRLVNLAFQALGSMPIPIPC